VADPATSASCAEDLGLGDKTYSGAAAADPKVYDIDGIDNAANTVKVLHALGDRAVCYIEVGTAGNYYSASDEGIATTYYAQLQAAGDLGSAQQGWPEYYLNVNAASTVSIIEAMISQQCAAKGFDAVETDNDEIFQYSTGFSISEANMETYMTKIANYIHSLNMAWFIKNPDDVGNASYADAMYPLADAVITEQCNQYDTCQYLSEYEGTKAIFNAEYTPYSAASFCPSDNAKGINGELFDVNLDAQVRVPCR
jgi:hypothetical protein